MSKSESYLWFGVVSFHTHFHAYVNTVFILLDHIVLIFPLPSFLSAHGDLLHLQSNYKYRSITVLILNQTWFILVGILFGG